MNTTKLGNLFEERVHGLLAAAFDQNRLLLQPKIFTKKGYYSKDRQSEIVVDISIEVYLPGQSEFSFLIVIECKDYSHPVPVNDVEEFYAKLQQIAGVNVKGVMASSNSFQEGAFNYAKARGIGLVRILDDSNFKWILARAVTGFLTYEQINRSQNNILWGLTHEEYSNDHFDFFGYVGDVFTYSVRRFFESLIKDDNEQQIYERLDSTVNKEQECRTVIPVLTKSEIEEVSSKILDRIGYVGYEVQLDEICYGLETAKELEVTYVNSLGVDKLGFEILGKISFDPNIITLVREPNCDPYRLRFTLAHELGHYFLGHFKYLSREHYSLKDYEFGRLSDIPIKEIRRMEWQANYFASSLLLPKKIFVGEFMKLIGQEGLRYKSFGVLFVDNQRCNLQSF